MRLLWLTGGLAVAALAAAVLASDTAVVLAALSLVAAFAGTAMTFGEMRTFAHGKALLRRNEVILNSAGEGIFGIDGDGAVTFANPAAARMTQYSLDEMTGRYLHGLVHRTKADGTPHPAGQCPMLTSLLDGEVHRCDGDVYWRKDGTSFPVEYVSTPFVDGDRSEGAVVVFRDVTDRRELERVKDQFTSVVSHELRTPLTSIRGSLGLLESGVLGPLPEKGQRMIQIAVENTDRLIRLINDILDLERMDSGAMDLRETTCDAAQLIARAAEAVMPMAVAADVTLTFQAEPALFSADADRLIQTLTNLLSNAVKFSPAGSSVHVTSEHAHGEMRFRVIDHGRGIPADRIDAIFGRFQQVDASDSRKKGGTGLGLAICRTIVEHHGGRIWAQSAPGAGSTFSFVVPAPLERVDVYTPSADRGRGPSVLVCDDDAGILEVMGIALQERGYRVIPARSGQVALERAMAERPDVILLDLLMADMSGWEIVQALGEQPDTVHIPIVILSVLPRCDREMAQHATVVDWLEKPAPDAALFDALQRAIRSRDDVFRVLFVEDDPVLTDVLSAMFKRHGVESFAAKNGHEAIELGQRVGPDVLVLDIGVPDVDGIPIVDWVRLHERLNALPMVVCTAHELEAADRERLILGSITRFLTRRQVTSEEFEQRVINLTQGRTPESRNEPEAHPAGR